MVFLSWTYDSLPLTRWLDKSGKPIEDHPELPTEHQAKEILIRHLGMPMEIMHKSKIVRETLKAKGYDLDEVKTGKVTVGEELRRLLEKLADDKPVVSESGKDRPEVTILKRGEVTHGGDSYGGDSHGGDSHGGDSHGGDSEKIRSLCEH